MSEASIPAVDERYNITVQEYIEIIHDLVMKQHVARVKDIARLRGVTRSSVSIALNVLRDLGLIDHEHYGFVSLTEDGMALSESLAKRHRLILTFLVDFLEIEYDVADREACRLEHTMSHETLNALVEYVKAAGECPLCNKSHPPDNSTTA